MRCTKYAIVGVLGSLGLSAIMQGVHGITDHRLNWITQRLYVVQHYRHKILHVERHLRPLTMSLARVCLRLARSTNHEPDWCLCLLRSTYHGSHPWFLVPSRYCDF